MARPSEIKATLGAATLFSTGTYAYDGTGNVTATGSDSFQYDLAGRLWQSSVSSDLGLKTDVYTYDAFGNIAFHTLDGSYLTLSPSSRTNRLTGTGTSYDAFGNLTARPTETFTYDLLSRMTRYSGSGGTEEYLYDGAGERVVRFGQVTSSLGIASPSGSTLPGATPGVSYSYAFQASGGTGPYTWSLVSGSLPSGLNLSPSGVLAGTPATSGSYSFTVKVRDAGQAVQEATRALSLVVSGTQGLSYYTVTPCRVLDTRDTGRGGPIVGGAQPRTFLAAGVCGIPSTARSLVSNVTLVAPPLTATVGLFPAGQATPTPLTVSGLARAGTVRAVFSMVRIDGPTPGSFSAVTDLPAGQSVHVIVDVSGYFAVAQGPTATDTSEKAPAAVGGVRFYTLRDEENRLSTEYQQDASIGTRVAKDYFYFGSRLVATNTAWGAAQGWHFYTTDHLGTPRLKTDLAGTVVARPKYRPFGERIDIMPEQGPELAGMERDTVSGDYYVHARYQRSSLGRFSSLDSIPGTPAAPASWNRYAYAKSSPLTRVDPDGLADDYFARASAYFTSAMARARQIPRVAVAYTRGAGFTADLGRAHLAAQVSVGMRGVPDGGNATALARAEARLGVGDLGIGPRVTLDAPIVHNGALVNPLSSSFVTGSVIGATGDTVTALKFGDDLSASMSYKTPFGNLELSLNLTATADAAHDFGAGVLNLVAARLQQAAQVEPGTMTPSHDTAERTSSGCDPSLAACQAYHRRIGY